MTTDTSPHYLRLWQGVPRELGYLLITYPLAIAAFVTTLTLFSAGLATLVPLFIGVFVIVGAFFVARAFGTLDIVLLEWTGRPRIERPEFAQRQPGFWGWLKSVFGNGHYWLYLLYAMVINFVVSLITWTLTLIVVGIIANGFSYWFWGRFVTGVSVNTDDWNISDWLGLVGQTSSESERFTVDSSVYFVLGLIFLALLPFITRGFTVFHHVIANGLLGAFPSDVLSRRVGDLTAAGAAASSAEGHSLRRLERDIHDGPQQRLVRLQMDLAAAERQLDSDPAKARTLIAEAMDQSKEALEELRALSRGFAPPILLDRGLIAALESAAVRSAVPTRVIHELGAAELPQELERNAYFVASEALANAAKHASATDIEVRVATRRVPEPDETWLDVVVTDNGVGGASIVEGHGLAGLEQRARGLGGNLEISSPEGGPTIVTVHFPVTLVS